MAPLRHLGNIEYAMPLDIRQFQRGRDKRDVWLMPDTEFRWHWAFRGRSMTTIDLKVEAERVKLTHQATQADGSLRSVCLDVALTYTACGLGGQRAWWLCPSCDQRVSVLFFSKNTFACRKCQKLAYPSQSETREDRALRVAGKIRRKLGWEPGVANPAGARPKGMHRRTFVQLTAKHDAAAQIIMREMARALGLLHRVRRQQLFATVSTCKLTAKQNKSG